MDKETVIELNKLSKCYRIYDRPLDRIKQVLSRGKRQFFREFWAVRDVSFTVKRGETLGIIGQNGSGKSTLLQMIYGTTTPTYGEFNVYGRTVGLLELGTGFKPEFTGRENVYMSATIIGLSKKEIDAKYEDIVSFADIGDFIEQPVMTYSSGMCMRLAFAIVAHVDADVLVIDEALAVGDILFTQKCMRFLRKFREHGTVILVSHDLGAVVSLCDQVIWLDNGSIRVKGTGKDVCMLYHASLYDSKKSSYTATVKTHDSQKITESDETLKNHRLNCINQGFCRNDIELLPFNQNAASFGKRGASITNVRFLGKNGSQLSLIVGGELVVLEVQAHAHQYIDSPIIGFFIKDRLGQSLFGDNTYLAYAENPIKLQKNQTIEAKFLFQMPVLPRGDYVVCVAIAEGTQNDHVQHHWIYDALILKSYSSSVSTGLIGIPIQQIELIVS